MKVLAGSRLPGLLTVLAAFLLPAMGIGVADALEVGEKIDLLVPNLDLFEKPPEIHQFTCAAITEHAYWLVQDTATTVDTGTVIWENVITQAEIDSTSAAFEGADGVYAKVTEAFGPPPDTDGDPRIYAIFADMPDMYGTPATNPRIMVHVWLADFDGSGEGNDIDAFYINATTAALGPQSYPADAAEWRYFSPPTGLAWLIRAGVKPDEETWSIRGLAWYAQAMVYGVTDSAVKHYGIAKNLDKYGANPDIQLDIYNAVDKTNTSPHVYDFAGNTGQSMMWYLYIAERFGTDAIYEIAQSDTTGFLAIARVIAPGSPDSTTIEDNILPLYREWIITNVICNLNSDYGSGIYKYEFFEDQGYEWGYMLEAGAFENRFDAYPWNPTVVVEGHGIPPEWSVEYFRFTGDWTGYSTIYVNGKYVDEFGSGNLFDADYTAYLIQVDTTAADIVSIEEYTAWDNIFNGTFELPSSGVDAVYIVLTNNFPGGPDQAKFGFGLGIAQTELGIALFQNYINDAYFRCYTSMYDPVEQITQATDWYGPAVSISHMDGEEPDSTVYVKFGEFVGDIWYGELNVWDTGSYEVDIYAFTIGGRKISSTVQMAVDFAEGSDMVLTIPEVSFNVPAGAVAPGSMVSLVETGIMDAGSPVIINDNCLEGVLTGPVSIGPATGVSGVLAFEAENADASIFRYEDGIWVKLDSYFQNGAIQTSVDQGGVYALGSGPGITSPLLPAEVILNGNFPNPFNAQTAISFSVPSACNATLRIYDMSGRLVRTLVDEEIAAASHTILWNGRDETGVSVGSGVYFCRLEAAGRSFTQKLICLE